MEIETILNQLEEESVIKYSRLKPIDYVLESLKNILNYPAFLFGGALRDELLGVAPKDYDIVIFNQSDDKSDDEDKDNDEEEENSYDEDAESLPLRRVRRISSSDEANSYYGSFLRSRRDSMSDEANSYYSSPPRSRRDSLSEDEARPKTKKAKRKLTLMERRIQDKKEVIKRITTLFGTSGWLVSRTCSCDLSFDRKCNQSDIDRQFIAVGYSLLIGGENIKVDIVVFRRFSDLYQQNFFRANSLIKKKGLESIQGDGHLYGTIRDIMSKDLVWNMTKIDHCFYSQEMRVNKVINAQNMILRYFKMIVKGFKIKDKQQHGNVVKIMENFIVSGCDLCPICRDYLGCESSITSVMVSECGHSLHVQCANEFFKHTTKKNYCPACNCVSGTGNELEFYPINIFPRSMIDSFINLE